MCRRVEAFAALPVSLIVAASQSGGSSGSAAIDFDPAPEPSGQRIVAQYAPPADVGPYPNDIRNLPGQILSVAEKVTSALAPALNMFAGFSTTAKITAPYSDALDTSTLIPFNPPLDLDIGI